MENDPNAKDKAVTALLQSLQQIAEKFNSDPNETKKTGRFQQWANTPFVVTLLGGILMTVLTSTWQTFSATTAKKAAEAEASRLERRRQFDMLFEARRKLLMDFVNHFPASQSRLYEYVYCHSWLAHHTMMDEHQSGRSFQQMWKRAEDIGMDRATNSVAHSFAPQIMGTFTNNAILQKAKALQTTLTTMFDSNDEKTLADHDNKVNAIYLELIEQMTVELTAFQQNSPYEKK